MRWLAVGGLEWIRMIGVVVRDREWRTLPPASARLSHRKNGWTLTASTPMDSGTLHWRMRVSPIATGIDVHARLASEGEVSTNRAGLVIVLPARTLAGARFVARHPTGGETRGRLPRAIAPHQPMRDIESLRITTASGGRLSLAFDGEVFEMEDQRNWLDPTFKIYGRPLALPAPYRILDGEHVEQHLRMEVTGPARRVMPRTSNSRRGSVPLIGIATAPGRVPSDAATTAALREVAPAFILHRSDSRGRGIAGAARLASAIGAELRLETFGESAQLAGAIRRAAPRVVAAYAKGPAVDRALKETGASVAGGTFADFVVLNREGVAASSARATFALCPTVHARDDRSMIETLDALPHVFAQARAIAGGRSLDVGPSSLRRRLSPRTARPDVRPPRGESAPYDADPRQFLPIAAAWLAGVVATAATTGVTGVCTFEAAGARGLVRASPSSRRRGHAIERSPAHAVLAALARGMHGPLILHGLDARRGAAFSVRIANALELWLVDLSGTRRRLPSAASRAARMHVAHRSGGASWTAMPTAMLRPYGIARIAQAPLASFVTSIARAWCDDAIGTHASPASSTRSNR
jgi:hypothetical protein